MSIPKPWRMFSILPTVAMLVVSSACRTVRIPLASQPATIVATQLPVATAPNIQTLRDQGIIRSLEQSTDLTLKGLQELFASSGSAACLESPASIWH